VLAVSGEPSTKPLSKSAISSHSVQRKMTRVENMNLSVQHVTTICFGF